MDSSSVVSLGSVLDPPLQPWALPRVGRDPLSGFASRVSHGSSRGRCRRHSGRLLRTKPPCWPPGVRTRKKVSGKTPSRAPSQVTSEAPSSVRGAGAASPRASRRARPWAQSVVVSGSRRGRQGRAGSLLAEAPGQGRGSDAAPSPACLAFFPPRPMCVRGLGAPGAGHVRPERSLPGGVHLCRRLGLPFVRGEDL